MSADDDIDIKQTGIDIRDNAHFTENQFSARGLLKSKKCKTS